MYTSEASRIPRAVETSSKEVDDVELECYDLLKEFGIPFEPTVPSTMSSVEKASENQVVKGKGGEASWLEGATGASTSPPEGETTRSLAPASSHNASSSSALPEESVASTSLLSPSKQVDDAPSRRRDASSLSLSRTESRRDSPPAHPSRTRIRSPRAGGGGESSKNRVDESTRTVVCQNLSPNITKSVLERHFHGLNFLSIKLWQKRDGGYFFADVELDSPWEAQLAIRRLDGTRIGFGTQPITLRLAEASSSLPPPSPRSRSSPRPYESTRPRSPEPRGRGAAEVDHNCLFIASLDPSVSELKLRQLFSPFGRLERIHLGVKSGTRDQHQAHIIYDHPRATHTALHAMNGQVIGSWKTSVKLSSTSKTADKAPMGNSRKTKPMCTLFIVGLDRSMTCIDLADAFSKWGEVLGASVVPGGQNPNFVIGFVRFLRDTDASRARNKSNGSKLGSGIIRVTAARHELESF